MTGLLHCGGVELGCSEVLLFLLLPVTQSSAWLLDELELVEMLPNEELLWLLLLAIPGDALSMGTGTGTNGVAISLRKHFACTVFLNQS